MAIYYQDLFNGTTGNLSGRTPDTVGSNPWTAETAAGTFDLDGSGAVTCGSYDSRWILTGDVAPNEYHEATVEGVFGAVASGSQIGVGSRHSGTGAENDSSRNGYLLWVSDQGYVELRKVTNGVMTADAGGFPGQGLTQITISNPATDNVKLKLITQNNGTDVQLQAWYSINGGAWTRINNSVYTDSNVGAPFTSPGRDALYMRPQDAEPTAARLLSFVGNTLTTTNSINGDVTVGVTITASMGYATATDGEVSETLVDAGGTPRANLSGISWWWFDSLAAAPTDSGLTSTDIGGVFTVSIPNSVLTAGQTGYLALEKSDQSLIGLYKLQVQ